jgi:hypothetical protein
VGLRLLKINEMEAEPLIYREEVIAMLLTLADIKFGINRIIWLLENGDDGEEEAQGNDS